MTSNHIADPSWVGERHIAWRTRLADGPGQDGRAMCVAAFSLLEVVLALAILAGALAALGEVMRLADENAAAAADESQAELLAESVMAELLVGARPLAAVNGAALPLASEPPWVLSIAVESTEFQELVAIRLRVEQQLAPQLQPAHCELVRWFPNPDYLPAATQQSATDGASSASQSSSSSSAGGGQP